MTKICIVPRKSGDPPNSGDRGGVKCVRICYKPKTKHIINTLDQKTCKTGAAQRAPENVPQFHNPHGHLPAHKTVEVQITRYKPQLT